MELKCYIQWLVVALSQLLAIMADGASAKQPNIIMILADDLGYGSLGCYGNRDVKTPNIDKLAAKGIRFTDFHSNGALCTPTRAALMTGRYPQRCEWVPDDELSPIFREQRKKNPVQRWAWGISANEVILPELLAQAGYQTALIGKWHLGYDMKFHPMNQGFDEFRGFIGGAVDYHTHIATHGKKELDWWSKDKILDETGYTTDLLTKHAVDFIGRNNDKPFFLYLAHAAPHVPWQGRDAKSQKSQMETYVEMIEVLDESVGEIVKALNNYEIRNNTLLIFCSDNGPSAPSGFSANAMLRGGKGSMYEGGHRVPMIASWPGVVKEDATCDAIAMTMDLLPTFVKLAGATIPESLTLDGIDLMPVLIGGSNVPERVLHWMQGASWAVREGHWKLIGKSNKPHSLVNLKDEITEKTNLMREKPDMVNRLHDSHQQWIMDVGPR